MLVRMGNKCIGRAKSHAAVAPVSAGDMYSNLTVGAGIVQALPFLLTGALAGALQAGAGEYPFRTGV
jgi:hypothetical protein